MDQTIPGPQHIAIAAVQFSPKDDKIANIDKALALIDQAASSGAQAGDAPGSLDVYGRSGAQSG